jgi:hypothetical protein
MSIATRATSPPGLASTFHMGDEKDKGTRAGNRKGQHCIRKEVFTENLASGLLT